MKWSVIGLILIGLVSASCVAILVGSLPGPQQAGAQEKVCLVEAIGPIEQGAVVTENDVVIREVLKGHEPAGVFRDKGQIIGKVLITAMSKGQAFTKACFPSEGPGLELANRLPEGMRAVSMEISNGFGLRGLLYPGCTVDILVSLRSLSKGEAVSRTLLEEVRVLAIDSRTVSSPEEEDAEKPKGEKSNNMMVTILVSSEQAQQLQLAAKHGTLSLALRNPRDTIATSHELTRLGALLGEKEAVPIVIPRIEIEQKQPEKKEKSPPKPKWQVTVIQGQASEDVEFPLPK
jgi:Flp pilus assembly protein CpaB